MKLILKQDSWSNATAFYLEDLYRKHFEISYDLDDEGIVYAHWQDWEWAKSLKRPAIIDHLWDPWDPEIVDTEYLKVIRSDGWFCIANECLWYRALGYDQYQAKNTNDRTFLMLMNYQRQYRDQLWEKIQPHLDNALYSYQDRGVTIEGDIAREPGPWQRYLNKDWYDQTKYSLVVESGIDQGVHSEKVLKPMAFRQPFVVWGPQGYLKWLRTWGFETFNNCIDESYDLEEDNNKRLEMIVEEVARINSMPSDYFIDQETQRRLDTNYKRFYNVEWATKQIEKYFDQIKQYSSSW